MSSPSVVRYSPPKSAPLPHGFEEFYESLSQAEKELHHLAIELWGSSYFPQWTPMYTRWAKKKAEAQKVEQAKQSP